MAKYKIYVFYFNIMKLQKHSCRHAVYAGIMLCLGRNFFCAFCFLNNWVYIISFLFNAPLYPAVSQWVHRVM